jgi:TolB-like protein/DNA-binding winged helix-turn-helix (wHTH) protein/tetratricopeptide (TPR) repeat protein
MTPLPPSPDVTLTVRFAGLVLSLDACMLARDSGEPVPLTRGEFALLKMFVSRPGRVIGRDTLLDAFAARRFESFDRSVDVVIGKLRKKIEPNPKQPRLIVTVPGEGYRFDGLRFRPPEIVKLAEGVGSSKLEGHSPPRLSIVVLPFANIGGDPKQEHFVHGVTESLTTDLSRLLGSFVISHNTALTYKGRAFDVRQIGRELNVRYVLAGSIQRAAKRMRVSVQLIEASSGNHLWADRFDKPVADLFDMQDEIVARLAKTLDTQLIAAAARSARRAPNPDSMDLFFQGLAWHFEGITPDSLATARRFFARALALDPTNFRALVQAAALETVYSTTFLPDDRTARLVAAEAAVAKALSLAPQDATAHLCMGMIQMSTNRASLAIRQCERALELDRNLANAHHRIGAAKLLLGRPEDTESHVEQALRLSPRDSFVFLWRSTAGSAKFWLSEEEGAVAWLRSSIEANGNYPRSHFILAAALAHLGRLDEAQSEVQAGSAIDQTFTIARFSAHVMSHNSAYLSGRERLIDGMRKAGVPED